jgi:ankyrin repeat protein
MQKLHETMYFLNKCLENRELALNIQNKNDRKETEKIFSHIRNGFDNIIKAHQHQVSCTEQFLSLCKKEEFDAAKNLILHIDVDYKNNEGDNAISLLLESDLYDENKFSLLSSLLEKKADVNYKNRFNRTPIMEACLRKRSLFILELLFNYEPNLNIETDLHNKDTAIDYLCISYPDDLFSLNQHEEKQDKQSEQEEEYKKKIKLLITYNFNVKVNNKKRPKYSIYVKNVIMKELMFDYIKSNNIKCVKLLLELGANANYINANKESLLMIACKSTIEIVKDLVEHYADINYFNDQDSVIDYVNPFFPEDLKITETGPGINNEIFNYLIINNITIKLNLKRPKFYDYIIKQKQIILGEELINACYKNDYCEIKRLIKLGACSKYNRNGDTTITATLHGEDVDCHFIIITLLLESGADPNDNGALLVACRKKNFDLRVISLLLKYGAQIKNNKNNKNKKNKDTLLDLLCPEYPNDIDTPKINSYKYNNLKILLRHLYDNGFYVINKEKRPNYYKFVKSTLLL